ncbi:IclR family transcriptional regulator C-terminal domain-containing protein [Streptomyces sp. 3211.6]|uniref:IclR family transcriptional regulator domain-containing protein n=1 Tax=Streptomyces sp. 3211.6 TaxID=1938845 RepID=UPI0037DA3673
MRETLAFLRDEVGAAVYVAAYTDGEVSITQYADSPTAPAVHEWVDFREAVHASAVGKALLVQLNPADRRDHLGRHRMEAFTPHTITNQEELFAELDTRDPGEPLVDLQEYALGTVCAAVPIRTGTDPECVALSLPTPDPRPPQARTGRTGPAQRSNRRPPGPPRRRQQPAPTHHAEHPLRRDPQVADAQPARAGGRAGERRPPARDRSSEAPGVGELFDPGEGRGTVARTSTVRARRLAQVRDRRTWADSCGGQPPVRRRGVRDQPLDHEPVVRLSEGAAADLVGRGSWPVLPTSSPATPAMAAVR